MSADLTGHVKDAGPVAGPVAASGDVAAPERVEEVRSAAGLLGAFNRAGVLGYADVHVARRLGELAGERDDAVLLAAALAVRAVRQGSVCLPLATVASSTAVDGLTVDEVAALPWPAATAWEAAVAASPLVACGPSGPGDRPLRLVDGLVYLDRYWRQERVVGEYVDRAVSSPPTTADPAVLRAALDRLFDGPAPDLQRLAAVVAAHRRFSIVAGGPGTGKTTTVARLLALLADLAGGELRVALAAPTGKAAARLSEAVAAATAQLPEQDRQRLGVLSARTLHRLLGSRPGARTRFWHDRDNRLPYDVVVVDEASMVPLTMMSRLVEALRPQSRLVLVGDPDQLASVEAGAVLGDLVARTPPGTAAPASDIASLVPDDLASLSEQEQDAALRGVVRLHTVHRFSAEIQELAEAVRSGSAEALQHALDAGHACIELVDEDPAAPTFACEPLHADVVSAGDRVVDAARRGDAAAALAAVDGHRVLCGHREGPYGVGGWAQRVESWLAEAIAGYAQDGVWYVGRPLLVTSNDYQLGLFNGDTGVVVSVAGEPRAAFRRQGEVDLIGPSRLSDVHTVHALSVHRSQGSQFDRVTLVLPPEGSPLLTRELVYTAITRAKEHVRIIGTRQALVTAIQRPVQRASGLRRSAEDAGPEFGTLPD